MFEKVERTNENLNTLLDNVANADVRLNIARNKFRSLHNMQFIESRVYEDDETVSQEEAEAKVNYIQNSLQLVTDIIFAERRENGTKQRRRNEQRCKRCYFKRIRNY